MKHLLCLLSIISFVFQSGNCLSNTIKDSLENLSSATKRSPKLSIYGYADFFSIYTDMKKAYPDYSFKKRQLTFSSYPDQGLVNRNSENPLLYLVMDVFKSDNTGLRVQYSLIHSFNGLDGDFGKSIRFRSAPTLEVFRNTRYGQFTLTAGDCTGKAVFSPLLFSGGSMETHPFERLPWDWHLQPFDKYDQIFNRYDNPLRINGLNAIQGFLFQSNRFLRKYNYAIFFGRSNFTATPILIQQNLPAYVFSSRFSRWVGAVNLSLNSYYRYQMPENSTEANTNQVYSVAVDHLKLGKGILSGELAFSSYRFTGKTTGASAVTAAYNRPKPSGLNFRADFYYIPYDFVSIDNAVYNSNTDVTVSGVPGDHNYNLTLYVNPVQQPGYMANNRCGISIMSGEYIGRVRISVNTALSRELEHRHDSLTFFHFNNSFTRSRFSPWFQGSGPFGRIGGRYRFTTETIPFETQGKPLWFASSRLNLKTMHQFNRKKIILLFGGGIYSAGPSLNNTPFLSVLVDFTPVLQLHPNLSLLANVTYQQNTGETGEAESIRQRGLVAGCGWDLKIAENAIFFFRYKRFRHMDKENSEDQFAGEEFTTELKIFF